MSSIYEEDSLLNFLLLMILNRNKSKLKDILYINRSKYIFAVFLVSLGIGILSKNVISYPTKCLPLNNQEITLNY